LPANKYAFMVQTFTLNCRGRLIELKEPAVMGILNVTPDSFFAGSRVQQEADLLRRAEAMLLDGALFLDIGGQSTRPGSTRIDEEEEMHRVLPAIEALQRNFPLAHLSIDSFYARVVRAAVEAGAVLVNDVSGGTLDPELVPTVAALQVPYVLMHLKGDLQTMQLEARYDNVVTEVFDALARRRRELVEAGIRDIIIDPGFGFAKTIAHNFRLLQQLSYFHQLGCPLLVGLSRKATVYRTLEITAEEALNGSTVLHTIALQNGAQLLRVHDVRAATEAIRLHRAVVEAQ
jgi:dihydropteroate synthase